jgi:hypothetical protein
MALEPIYITESVCHIDRQFAVDAPSNVRRKAAPLTGAAGVK